MARSVSIWLLAVMLLSVPASAIAIQPDPATPVVAATVDEEVSMLLMDAMRARTRLRENGERQRADALWASFSRFVAIVRDADPDDQGIFLPIIAGFRSALAEQIISVQGSSPGAVDDLQGAVDDQIRIHTAPGFNPGARGGVLVTVSGIRGTEPVPGLYAWLDLTGSVPTGMRTSKAAPGVTPAQAMVGPGRYLVRLVQGTNPANMRVVGSRITTIGNLGAQENVVVQVDQP